MWSTYLEIDLIPKISCTYLVKLQNFIQVLRALPSEAAFSSLESFPSYSIRNFDQTFVPLQKFKCAFNIYNL